MDYKAILQPYAERAIENRRYLHANPELSFEEVNTNAFIKEQLAGLDVEFDDKYSGYSVVGYINGTADGPTIGVRADIDALPVQEEVDLPFKSTKDGVMHACGHDAHTATLIEFVRFFAEHKDLIKGRIKFIFQAAEEKLPGGAVGLCKEGVCDDVDSIYAWHVTSLQPVGKVSLVKDVATAAVGGYRIEITGHGGHGGFPHLSINPVNAAGAMINAINQLITTKVDALKSGVITVAYVQAGTDWIPNIIPGKCVIGGNIRSLDNDTRQELMEEVDKLAAGICAAYGCTYEMVKDYGYPATICAEKEYGVMEAVMNDMGLENANNKPQLGAEDFAYYTLEKPACYISIGMNDPSAGPVPVPHHNCKFSIDDVNGIPVALEYFVRVYLKAVE